MTEFLISIIVPVYNAEIYVGKCINSVINQTLSNWELILVIDGSIDMSASICDKYSKSDSRIRVIHKENRGVSSARNIGLSAAKGEYITFIDADDWIEPTYLEDFAADNISEENVLIIQGIKQFYPKWNKFSNMFSYNQEEFNLKTNPEVLYKKGIIMNGCPVAKLFCKKILSEHKIRFNEDISLNEDHLFCIDYIVKTDKIILRENINYVYLYDFQVPSLTKIKHSAHKSIITAKALHQSISNIINRFSLDDSDQCFSSFGPYQLIRGSISCFNDINGYNDFSSIIEEYMHMTYNRIIVGYDLYSKAFIFFVNKVSVKNLYYIQFIIYNICSILNKFKHYIKIVIPKKCSIL